MTNVQQSARMVLRRLLRAGGLDVRRPVAPLLKSPAASLSVDLEHLIALRMLERRELFFLQIGAFDGRTDDALHEYICRYGWRGILVEPQPRYFAELQKTYAGHPGLDLRNVAVSVRRGTRMLYAVDLNEPGLPEWAPQIASFDRRRLEATGFAIREYQVDCVTVADLLVGVERLDLLQIDAEGYDAELIDMFDFTAFRPSIVRFENVCLSRADHERAVGRLVHYGYQVAVVGTDTIGWGAP
jgi:FkbM family methyltransferase